MLKVFTLAAFLFAAHIISPIDSSAQTRARQMGGDGPARGKSAPVQNREVAAELHRQQKFLRDIAARYEEVSTHDLTPLLKYSYIWNALRENRSRIATPGIQLTASQSRLFRRAYDQLEQDVLLLFLDHQIRLLNEALELNEVQLFEVQKTLTMDLNGRRALLATKNLSGENFRRRLDQLSDTTEQRILALLFPEQRKLFDRQLMRDRNRLVG